MSVPFLDLSQQYESISSELDAAVQEVVRSQRFILGEPVERLESRLADLLGVEYAVGCASGTDALLLPLRAFWSKSSDEVVIPAFTFFATAGAVWNAGFRPAFCDVDPVTFNLTRESVEASWTEETRGVVPVHLYGQMAPMAEIESLAEERGGFVLEDAAQAIGASQRSTSPPTTGRWLTSSGRLGFTVACRCTITRWWERTAAWTLFKPRCSWLSSLT
jgi:dTDP-4-amino-4,6-dideoxygalactose transaminase